MRPSFWWNKSCVEPDLTKAAGESLTPGQMIHAPISSEFSEYFSSLSEKIDPKIIVGMISLSMFPFFWNRFSSIFSNEDPHQDLSLPTHVVNIKIPKVEVDYSKKKMKKQSSAMTALASLLTTLAATSFLSAFLASKSRSGSVSSALLQAERDYNQALKDMAQTSAELRKTVKNVKNVGVSDPSLELFKLSYDMKNNYQKQPQHYKQSSFAHSLESMLDTMKVAALLTMLGLSYGAYKMFSKRRDEIDGALAASEIDRIRRSRPFPPIITPSLQISKLTGKADD